MLLLLPLLTTCIDVIDNDCFSASCYMYAPLVLVLIISTNIAFFRLLLTSNRAQAVSAARIRLGAAMKVCTSVYLLHLHISVGTHHTLHSHSKQYCCC
jgi:hypothetical protein